MIVHLHRDGVMILDLNNGFENLWIGLRINHVTYVFMNLKIKIWLKIFGHYIKKLMKPHKKRLTH